MKVHDLKIAPEYYKEVKARNKRFEIRKNDRDFKVGDEIRLREFDGDYTDSLTIAGEITYITDYAQQDGYVVFGFKFWGE